MKKIGIKMLGLILAVSMVCAILPVAVMATPVTDGGYIKFEAEADSSNNFKNGTQTVSGKMSGDKFRKHYNTSAAQITFTADITTAGGYTIWFYASDPTSAYCSAAEIVVDGTTHLTIGNVQGSNTPGGQANFPFAYQSANTTLTAGTHSIQYVLTAPRTSDNTNYCGGVDFMLLIPVVGYDDWTPSLSGLPVARTYNKNFNADGYAWFQAENYSARNGFSTSLTDTMFVDGTAYGTVTTTTGTYYVDFYMNVPKTTTYDVWINGTDPDYEWCSPVKLLIDGTEYATTAISGRETADSNKNYQFLWRKATITITAGKHDLRYLMDEKRSGDNNYYAGTLDVICIVPSSWGWTNSLTQPVKPAHLTNAWIEGESYTETNFTSYNTSTSLTNLSGGSTHQIHKGGSPGASGYYSDYNVFLQAGTYDIYFRGVDDTYSSQYMSNAVPYVDGTAKSYTSVVSEGWNPNGLSDYAHGWLKVSGVTVTEERHTIRWGYPEKRAGGDYYIGGLDCFAIVPSGAPFTPVAGNITNTKLDYYMSLLLLGEDLANVTEDITLPTTLEDGTSVSWASSNTTAIATDGTVIRPINSDANVTLTATAGGYSKNFAVTVKYTDEFEITGFAIGGSATAGGTATATATVKRNGGANGTASLILAIYNEHEEMVGVNIDQDTVNLTPNTLNCSYAIPAGQTGSLVARAFLWTDFSELRPITTQLSTN